MLDEWTPILTLKYGPMPAFKLAGEEVEIVTWDGKRPTVGLVTPKLVTGRDMVIVHLDDGSQLKVSEDQVLLLREGRKYAGDLTVNDSLLAFYTRRTRRFVHYLDPKDWHKGGLASSDQRRWRPLPRMIAEHKLGRRLQPGEQAQIVSKDRLDFSTSNIVVVEQDQKKRRYRDKFGQALNDAKRFLDAWPTPRNHRVTLVEQGHCFAAGSRIYVANGSMITPMTIESYAAEGIWRPVLGYDEQKKLIRKVNVTNAWLTKKAAPVMKIGFSNNTILRVTPEHQVLTADGTYVEAWKLVVGTRVVSAIAGFSLRSQSVLTNHTPGTAWVNQAPKPDQTQPYRVYDITTETGNVLVDGIICHNSTACLSISGLSSDSFVGGEVFLATDRG